MLLKMTSALCICLHLACLQKTLYILYKRHNHILEWDVKQSIIEWKSINQMTWQCAIRWLGNVPSTASVFSLQFPWLFIFQYFFASLQPLSIKGFVVGCIYFSPTFQIIILIRYSLREIFSPFCYLWMIKHCTVESISAILPEQNSNFWHD